MSGRIIYNSEAINEVFLYNSSFLYGESVFTSSWINFSKLPFKEDHLSRLEKGSRYLFDIKENQFFDSIKNKLEELLELNNNGFNNYLRITIYKGHCGNFQFSIILDKKVIPANDLKITIHKSNFCSGFPEYVKVGNYAYKYKVKKDALLNKFDDVLFIDENEYLCELSTSNVFFYNKKKNMIVTPKLGANVLDGIIRKNLLLYFNQINQPCIEVDIKLDELSQFDEAISTNAFSGIRSLIKIDEICFNIGFFNNLLKNFKMEN